MGISDKLFESVSERLVAKVDRSSWRSWTSLEISPDSKRVAYTAMQKGKLWMLVRRLFVVVDGEEGKPYFDIFGDTLSFSPDSKRVAYMAGEKGKQFVVVDGEEGKQYDVISLGPSIFSPDSKRIAHVAIEKGKQFVVVDGEEGKQYDTIVKDTLIFSSDDSIRYLALLGSSIYSVEARTK